jgi:hypothetical protein
MWQPLYLDGLVLTYSLRPACMASLDLRGPGRADELEARLRAPQGPDKVFAESAELARYVRI